MTHLVIENQNSNTEIVSAAIILKLYEMALSAEGDVSLKGNLLSDHAKLTAYDYLTGNLTGTSTKRFPELSLNVTGGIYIDFLDPLVEQILSSNSIGDGTGITQSDLYAINRLEGSWFSSTNITSFNELLYFKPSAVNQQGTFANCDYLTEVTLPSGITIISTYLFKGCDVLESINNTQSITEVMYGGLTECPSLESLNLLSLTTVGQYAFAQDTNLLSIGNCAPVTIGEHAFENCSSLLSIDLSNCTSIREYAFKGCTGLSHVTFPNVNYTLSSKAFYGCTALALDIDLTNCTDANVFYTYHNPFARSGITSIKISLYIDKIGGYDNANEPLFFVCRGLEKADLSQSILLTSIDALRMFQGCKNLKYVKFPSTITEFKNEIFYNWSAADNYLNTIKIYLPCVTPPTMTKHTLCNKTGNGTLNPTLEIYVPTNSISAYQADADWNLYTILDILNYSES